MNISKSPKMVKIGVLGCRLESADPLPGGCQRSAVCTPRSCSGGTVLSLRRAVSVQASQSGSQSCRTYVLSGGDRACAKGMCGTAPDDAQLTQKMVHVNDAYAFGNNCFAYMSYREHVIFLR